MSSDASCLFSLDWTVKVLYHEVRSHSPMFSLITVLPRLVSVFCEQFHHSEDVYGTSASEPT